MEILSYVGVQDQIGIKQNWTKQNVAEENDFQLCTAGSNLMLLIHDADEEFYRTRKSVQFELIAIQTKQCL